MSALAQLPEQAGGLGDLPGQLVQDAGGHLSPACRHWQPLGDFHKVGEHSADGAGDLNLEVARLHRGI